jgi:ubiquinone/menaquinone biosynthesis C-methylase UbiE
MLDLGCGIGNLALALAGRQARRHGDRCGGALHCLSRSRHGAQPMTFTLGDASRLLFDDACFAGTLA